MKPAKKLLPPPKPSSIKQALLGLYGIVGISLSVFGGFKVPFAESNAKDHWRHALAGIILIFALLAGLVSFALYIFNANYFKSQIVDYVKTNNQRDLTLDGDLKITFFPKLGLDAGKMTVSQRNSSKSFASIENAHFYIAWWPLVLKQLEIESVVLNGAHANVIRYKNGSTNLDDLFASDEVLSDIKFAIDSIKLINSSIHLQDDAAGLFFSLHDMNLETGKLADATPGDISASFRLESAKPRMDSKVKLTSHLLLNLKAKHYEFANIEGEMEGEAAGLSTLILNFQGSINSYPALGKLTLDKFAVNIKGKLDERKIDAKLDIPKLQILKKQWTGSSLVFSTTLLQEDENLSTNFELPAFEISEKKLKAENMSASFDLFKTGRTLQGKLSSPLAYDFATMQMDLANISSNISGTHPLFANKLTANISGSLQSNFSEKNIKASFKAKIDNNTVVGSASLQDFSHPAYSFDLAFNALDLDHYLATDYNKRFQDESLPFDFGGLKNLNLRGKLRSGEFKFAKLKSSNLQTEIKIEQSALLLDALGARLYGGNMLGSLSISANDPVKISLKQKLTGIQLNALLADIAPGESKLVGRGNLSLDISASGKNMGDLRKSVNGNIGLALGKGSFAGVNLAEELVAGKGQLGMPDGERSSPAKFSESTTFTEFKSTFELHEGKANTHDFLMKSPLLSCKGDGEINLDTGQLNYRLNTTVAGNLKRATSGELADLKGINVPMKVNGSFAAPSYLFEFASASGGNMAKIIKTNLSKTASPATTTTKSVAK